MESFDSDLSLLTERRNNYSIYYVITIRSLQCISLLSFLQILTTFIIYFTTNIMSWNILGINLITGFVVLSIVSLTLTFIVPKDYGYLAHRF